MAWSRPGDKPLSEPVIVRSLTHICVAQPQWVNKFKIYIISDWIQNTFDLKSCYHPKGYVFGWFPSIYTPSANNWYIFHYNSVLRQLTSRKMEPLSPGVIFTPLLLIFKILYWKIGDMLCSMVFNFFYIAISCNAEYYQLYWNGWELTLFNYRMIKCLYLII